jgi:hypothetical protein
MSGYSAAANVSSLAAVSSGDRVRIRNVLGATLRRQCDAVGLAQGDVVQCRTAGRASLVLVKAGGRTVLLDRDSARFIQVSADGAALR